MEGSCRVGFLRRQDQKAFKWRDSIIILGGCEEWSHVTVKHCDGRWQCKKTTGLHFITATQEVFPEGGAYDVSEQSAELVGDKVYMMASSMDSHYLDGTFVLDLTNWSWTFNTPRGNPPLHCCNNVSWVHNSKIYSFGGIWEGSLDAAYALGYPTGCHRSLGVTSGATNMTNQLFWQVQTIN